MNSSCAHSNVPESETVLKNVNVGFIGAGKMAQSIAKGFVSSGIISSSQIYASAPSASNSAYWIAAGSHFVPGKNAQLVKSCDVVFLAMKPYQLEEFATQLSAEMASEAETDVNAKRRVLISVVSSISLLDLKSALGKSALHFDAIIRIVTNTASAIRKACTVYACSSDLNESQTNIVESLLGSIGIVLKVPEKQLNLFTALIGSGPAFIYLVIESLADGAVKTGLPRQAALSFAAQMVSGAAGMVLETGTHPGQLKDEVCSPGGTTIHGMYELETRGVRGAFMSAVGAAVHRCEEMSKK